MTTETLRRDIQSTDAERRGTDAARLAGAIAAGERADWRADSLERAGDYAVAGMFQASKRFSQMFIEGK